MTPDRELPKESEELVFHQQLREAAEFLKPNLTQNECLRLPQTIALAASMLSREIRVHPEMLDATDPDSLIRLSLVLALCDQWITARGNFALRQKLSESILMLIPQPNRNYVESDETLAGTALDDTTMLLLLSEAFPHSSIDWNITTLEAAERELAVDGIIRLPYKIGGSKASFYSSEARNFLERVYQKAGIKDQERFYFLGLYTSESKIIVFWEDSPRKTEIHEVQHRDNDGLLVGGLGTVLNEAVTDMRAYQIWRTEGATDQDIATDMRNSAHLQAIRLTEALFEQNSKLNEVMNRYYERKNEADAKELISLLVTLLGWNSFAALYAANLTDSVIVRIQNELEQKKNKISGGFSFKM